MNEFTEESWAPLGHWIWAQGEAVAERYAKLCESHEVVL